MSPRVGLAHAGFHGAGKHALHVERTIYAVTLLRFLWRGSWSTAFLVTAADLHSDCGVQERPLVSVIVPVFNDAERHAKCL